MAKKQSKRDDKPGLRELLVEMIANQRLILDSVGNVQSRLSKIEDRLSEQKRSDGPEFFVSQVEFGDDDELYDDAKLAIIHAGKASTSYLQRKLRIGYSRAARLMDLLEERGVIGPQEGSHPREVLIDPDEED